MPPHTTGCLNLWSRLHAQRDGKPRGHTGVKFAHQGQPWPPSSAAAATHVPGSPAVPRSAPSDHRTRRGRQIRRGHRKGGPSPGTDAATRLAVTAASRQVQRKPPWCTPHTLPPPAALGSNSPSASLSCRCSLRRPRGASKRPTTSSFAAIVDLSSTDLSRVVDREVLEAERVDPTALETVDNGDGTWSYAVPDGSIRPAGGGQVATWRYEGQARFSTNPPSGGRSSRGAGRGLEAPVAKLAGAPYRRRRTDLARGLHR